MNNRRYRITRRLVHVLYDYLVCESEYEPELNTLHLEEEVKITATFPASSNMPSYEIIIREKA